MNNDSENHTKWKKFSALMTQGILYVMQLLAILLAFLPIVIIIALALGWVSTETQLIIKIPKIITLTIVLITIYLIPFLCVRSFRESLSKIKETTCKVSRPKSLKETFTESLKLAAYPMHFAIRMVVRFLLLVAMLLPVLFSLILIVFSIALFLVAILAWSPELLKSHEVFSILNISSLNNWINDNTILIKITTLIIFIFLIWFLIEELKNDVANSISNIKAKIVKVVQGRWVPEMNIRKSLSVTWQCYIAKFWLFLKEMHIESKKLFVAVLILCIISFCGYIIDTKLTDETPPDLNEWQASVREKLDAIKGKTDNIAISEVNTWRKNLTSTLGYIKKNIEPSISYSLKKNAQFSLYYEEGNLETKEGICSEGSNLEWLELFKTAISDGSKDRHLKLKIQGFASIAPVRVNDDTTLSNTLNCQIANERAEALIYFLTLPDSTSYDPKKCKDDLDDGHR